MKAIVFHDIAIYALKMYLNPKLNSLPMPLSESLHQQYAEPIYILFVAPWVE